MENEIISGARSAWSFALMALGVGAMWLCVSPSRRFKFRYLGLSVLGILGGIAVISPMAAGLIVGFFFLMFALLVAMGFSDWRHDRQFPVFDTEPKWRFTDDRGHLRQMYIAPIRSRFIIGIRYEVEVDGTEMRMRTRWKDEFLSYDEAERELRRRAAEYGQPEEAPVAAEQPCSTAHSTNF